MIKKYLFAVLLLVGAAPAMAMKVTNLDTTPHRVVFESMGVKQVHALAPDESVTIAGQPGGTLSLLSAKPAKPSTGTVHSDGILRGIVGAARTENIPAEPGDEFAIWPTGQLLLQKHRTQEGNGNIF